MGFVVRLDVLKISEPKAGIAPLVHNHYLLYVVQRSLVSSITHTGTLCACEVDWTPDEWAKIVEDHKLPADTEPPERIQDTISTDK